MATRRSTFGTAIGLAAILVACDPGGTLIVASEGGSVSSPDGAFTIFIPPGALAEDTRISIDELGEDDWPVQAPSRFTRVGNVYSVSPATLRPAGDIYGLMIFPSVPDVLRSPDGDDVLAVHYVYNEKVQPAPATRTVHMADGRVAIVATLYEVGVHWTGERIPGADRALVMVSSRIEAQAGDHASGEEWRATTAALYSDGPLALVGREARSAVSSAGTSAIEPLATTGWTARTWDATWDPDLGLDPWQIFGVAPEDRTETVASFEDPAPITIDGELAPFVGSLPGWGCTGEGSSDGSLWVGVDVVSGASAGTLRAGVVREIGAARCH